MKPQKIVCPRDFCWSGVLLNIDEKGAHFICAECGHEWSKPSIKLINEYEKFITFINIKTERRGCFLKTKAFRSLSFAVNQNSSISLN